MLLTCNALGTQKLKPLVIHKSERPRAFRRDNFNVYDHVEWESNSTAWMRSGPFKGYMERRNEEQVRLDAVNCVSVAKLVLVTIEVPAHVVLLASIDPMQSCVFPRSALWLLLNNYAPA